MALSQQQVLNQLIHQFSRALAAERKDRWAEIDVAARIFTQFSYSGIKSLAASTGVGERTLIEYARIGVAFPPAVRDPYLTMAYTYFRSAVRIAKLHPNEVGADPVYWLREAANHGWSSSQLLRHGQRQRTTPTANGSPTDSILYAHRQIQDGLHDQGVLRARLAHHNAVYGPFTGQVFQVTLVPYVPVEPPAR